MPQIQAQTSLLKRVAFRVSALAVAAGLSLTAASAHADNHALIMWIGDYGNARMNLPGIDLDAANARKIATAMGVPQQNIRELGNEQLTKDRISVALAELTSRIANGDKVFLYYSGHGAQLDGVGGSKCTEGLVTRDPKLFEDFRLQAALQNLGDKASQVVMMNDSCFSGGQATKDASLGSDDFKPKFWSDDLKGEGSSVAADHTCGEAVNKMSRNLEVVGNSARRPQVLYIAASAANEVSYASRRGSVATLAWASCIAKADSNRSGSIDGEELKSCAQDFITTNRGRQTVTVVGNAKLPLFFNSQAGSNIDPVRALEDIRATRDVTHTVNLKAVRSQLRIGQDYLDFNISTNKPGYLYILQVGSDGQTFNMLFPNKLDGNNYIAAGNHSFPRPSWRIRSGGPAGTSSLLAIVSPVQKQIGGDMKLDGVFATANTDARGTKTLLVEATGASGGSGRIGVSEVVRIDETN
jgi:Caspase domain/Domain of unknown function (DUF4384)